MRMNSKSFNSKSFYAYFALVISMMFGFAGTSAASTCALDDVIIDGNFATSCGTGSTNNDGTPDDTSLWQVNLDDAGYVSLINTTWEMYEKEEGVLGGPNAHDGNTTNIGLVSSEIGDNQTSGEILSINVFDPTLITLKDGTGTLYHWYYFEGFTGTGLSGTWTTLGIFGPDKSLSNITAYATPVPAAVWLFGSGLLGLVGMARRKKS